MMEKCIGFDIGSKEIVAGVVKKGENGHHSSKGLCSECAKMVKNLRQNGVFSGADSDTIEEVRYSDDPYGNNMI